MWRKKTIKQGFTLIEVLIALVIVSVSLGAFLQSSQSNINHTFLLKHSVLSQYLLWNQFISQKDNIRDDTYTFNKTISKTAVQSIRKIEVSADYEGRPLTTLTQFIYAP